MTKISQLTNIGSALAGDDEFVVRDVSDVSTPNKKVTSSGIIDYIISQGSLSGFTQIAAGVGPLARVQVTSSGATGAIILSTAAATTLLERVRIDSAGRMGVGTSSPSTLLDVAGSAKSNYSVVVSGLAAYVNAGGGLYSYFSSTAGTINAVTDNSGTAGTLIFATGTEKARIDSSGRMLIGTSTFAGTNAYSASQRLSIAGTAFQGVQIQGYSSDEFGIGIDFSKSRGSSIGTNTIVQNGDSLGTVIFNGFDGTGYTQAAWISAQVDGTPGTNDMPGRLVFNTTADGTNTPTEILRLTSNKYLRMAASTGGIQFNGDTAAANALDDYEEGAWTPVLTFATAGNLSVAYSVQLGSYTKIGDKVTVHFRLTTSTFTHTTASGALRITGLPFPASAANPGFQGSTFSGFQGITNASYTQYSSIVENGTSHLAGAKSGSGQSSVNIVPADMPTGGTVVLHGSVTYKA